jgi:hypothetical protein
VTLHPLSLASVFIYSSCGKWVFPRLLWSFPPSATFTSFPAPLAGQCCCSCLLRHSFFIYSSGRDSPPPLFGAQGAPPSFPRVFIVLIAYYSVSLFFPRWGLVCPGGYADLAQGCLWEYRVQLSSPCGSRLLKPSGHWSLVAAQGPSWFLHLT